MELQEAEDAEAVADAADLDDAHKALQFAETLEAAFDGFNPAALQLPPLPEELREPLRELTRDIYDLGAVYKTQNRGELLVQRAQALGVYDWLVSRAPRLWGTDDDIARRLGELGAEGLTNWLFYGGSFYGETLRLVDLLKRQLSSGIT